MKMSAAQVITIMEKLCALHEILYELEQEKEKIVKENDVDGLNNLLAKEQKYIAAIQTMEKERKKEVANWLGRENATISDCIEKAVDEEKEKLVYLREKLMDIVELLKQQNKLNQQLIYQSLQFITFSLNLLRPQPKDATYSHPNQKIKDRQGRSLFDSKA
jgi:flagellar biosynthesis/type III secretory pathway chaperone